MRTRVLVSAAVRIPTPSSVSFARCSSHLFPNRPLFAVSFPIRSALGHDDYGQCVATHCIRLYTFPLSWPRASIVGALLAYLPSLHGSVSSRLSAPSQGVLATPCDQWPGDMICRCGVAASAADSFGYRLFTRHHSPVGFYQVAGD